jgi:hypothetical protein
MRKIIYDLFNEFDSCSLVMGVLFFLASSNGCCRIFFARHGTKFQIRLWLATLPGLNNFPAVFVHILLDWSHHFKQLRKAISYSIYPIFVIYKGDYFIYPCCHNFCCFLWNVEMITFLLLIYLLHL